MRTWTARKQEQSIRIEISMTATRTESLNNAVRTAELLQLQQRTELQKSVQFTEQSKNLRIRHHEITTHKTRMPTTKQLPEFIINKCVYPFLLQYMPKLPSGHSRILPVSSGFSPALAWLSPFQQPALAAHSLILSLRCESPVFISTIQQPHHV
jgi:hypothetical protein